MESTVVGTQCWAQGKVDRIRPLSSSFELTLIKKITLKKKYIYTHTHTHIYICNIYKTESSDPMPTIIKKIYLKK